MRQFGINSFILKCIAVVTMTMDHAGMMLFPDQIWLRCVGRLAFPIYCFLIVEGFVHTSDVKRYESRLFLFALISEIPFNYAVSGQMSDYGHQNVFFTLFLGLILIDCISRIRVEWQKVLVIVAVLAVAELAHVDYGLGGVAFILFFYLLRDRRILNCAAFAIINICVFGGLQNYAILSLIPINLYNGKKGPSMKYFFYVFYPVHLFVLYWIRIQYF